MSEDPKTSGKARSELVLAILRDELGIDEAAERHGVSREQIERWRDEFVAAGNRQLEHAPSLRKPRPARARGLLLLLGAIVVLAGVGVAAVFGVRWLKQSGESESSRLCRAGTLDLVKSAHETVSIVLYASQGNDKLKRTSDQLDALLARYAKESNGRLHYERRIVSDDAQREQALSDGLQPMALADGAGESVSQVIFGLTIACGAEKGAIPMLSVDEIKGEEFWIANKIREVLAKAENRSVEIGVLSGIDGLGLADRNLIAQPAGPSIVSILNQAFPYYALRDVAASSSSAELGQERALFVTQPGRLLTDPELRRLDDFLMLGDRALVVIASAVNVKAGDASMQVTLDRRGLDRLLDGYGIELVNDALFDPGSAVQLSVAQQDGTLAKIGTPALLVARNDEKKPAREQRLNRDFAGFFRLDELSFPAASTLVPHPEKQPQAVLSVVAKTTEQAVGSSDPRSTIAPGAGVPRGQAGERAIAIALEGKIKSAFGDRVAPGRLLVVASSLFATNPFARAAHAANDTPMLGSTYDPTLSQVAQAYAQRHLTSTILAIKNMLDWASADQALIACSATILPPQH